MWYILQGYTIAMDEDHYVIWRLDGKRHREDGPAIVTVDGHMEWWLNGKIHRIDGPAVISTDGTKRWYINGDILRLELKNGAMLYY